MKLFKQDYISFDGSGSFVTVSGDARESVVDDADVAYRLSRIAEEERERMTAEGTAPNAVDAADMSAYTGVRRIYGVCFCAGGPGGGARQSREAHHHGGAGCRHGCLRRVHRR